AALRQGISIEYVDRMYGSGETTKRLHVYVSPGTTKSQQKWTERQLTMSPTERKNLSTKPAAGEPEQPIWEEHHNAFPQDEQAIFPPKPSPGHESPALEGITEP
ncbi:hypothetical protein SARC_07987, partial [Sphaeroforma arctica JP610]